jgi:hypothetical protein
MLDVPAIREIKAINFACFVNDDKMLDILFENHSLSNNELYDLFSFASVGRRKPAIPAQNESSVTRIGILLM